MDSRPLIDGMSGLTPTLINILSANKCSLIPEFRFISKDLIPTNFASPLITSSFLFSSIWLFVLFQKLSTMLFLRFLIDFIFTLK